MTMFLCLQPVTGTLFVLFVVVTTVLLFVRHIRRPKDANKNTIPGPFCLPILGASYIVGRYKKPWDAFSALRKKYGDIYWLQLGSRNCVVVSSLRLMREVLVNKSQDFSNRPDFLRFHAIFRGDRNFSIALCDWSSKQKLRRSIAFPFMHPRSADIGYSRMNNFINAELRWLLPQLAQVHHRVIQPRKLLLICTANIFYQFLCSKRFSTDDSEFLNVVEIYDMVFHELFQGFAIDFMPWLRWLNRSKLERLKNLADNVSVITAKIFKEHEDRKNKNSKDQTDLVDVFLEQCSSKEDSALSREEAEVIIDDLVGGHSVLSNLWLWGLYFLATNPSVAKKIRQETLAVTSGCRQTTLDDRHVMPYTEATVMELLRVISSPIIPHVATKDTSIQGYEIPKDCMVMFNTYDINMDRNYWTEPEVFQPERFLNGNNKIIKPEHFFPFSVGKRTCMGDGLVRAVLFLGFTSIIENFNISLPVGAIPLDVKTICGMVVTQQEIELVFQKISVNQRLNFD